MGCPPTSARSSFHARNKLLSGMVDGSASVLRWPKKEWADRTASPISSIISSRPLRTLFAIWDAACAGGCHLHTSHGATFLHNLIHNIYLRIFFDKSDQL